MKLWQLLLFLAVISFGFAAGVTLFMYAMVQIMTLA
jgi:hypothetical protein